MGPCRECGAPLTPDATWCGACGAAVAGELPRDRADEQSDRLAAGPDAPSPVVFVQDTPVRSVAVPQDPRRARRDRSATSVVLALLALVALVAVSAQLLSREEAADPRPREDATSAAPLPLPGRDEGPATRGDAPAIRWARRGVLPSPVAEVEVLAAGPAHVLVDGQVVPTGEARGQPLLWLPPSVRAAVDGSGRWAVAEGGRLLVGTVTGELRRAQVAGRWRPAGAALAWHDGAVLMSGTGGRLGLVEDRGEVRWTTDVAVDVATVGRERLEGRTAAGDRVVVDLVDGAVGPAADPVAEVVVDVSGLVVTVDAVDVVTAAGEGAWERAVPGARDGGVVATDEGVVVSGTAGAVLLDRATGEELARVPIASAVGVDGGTVVMEDGGLTLRRWDGSVGWRQVFDARTVLELLPIDARRVAVAMLAQDGSTLVKVLDERGVTLATLLGGESDPRSSPTIAGGLGRLVGVRSDDLATVGGLAWIDAPTGVDGSVAARVAIEGGDGDAGWQFRGAVPTRVATTDERSAGDDPGAAVDGADEEPVLVRRAGPRVLVRVGDREPVAVDLGGTSSPVGVPAVTPDALAFPTSDDRGRLVLVDWREGEVVEVPGVAVGPSVGSVQLGVVAPASAADPFGRGPRSLVALDPEDGRERWRAPQLGAVGSVAPDAPTVIGPASTPDGPGIVEVGVATVRARDLADGRVRWVAELAAPVTTAPLVVGDRVVVPVADGTVVLLDGVDGTVLEQRTVGHVTALTATDAAVVVGTLDGRVGRLGHDAVPTSLRDVDQRAVVDLAWRAGRVLAAVGDALVGIDVPGPPVR